MRTELNLRVTYWLDPKTPQIDATSGDNRVRKDRDRREKDDNDQPHRKTIKVDRRHVGCSIVTVDREMIDRRVLPLQMRLYNKWAAKHRREIAENGWKLCCSPT